MKGFEGRKGKRKWCTYFRITKLKEILLKYPHKRKKKRTFLLSFFHKTHNLLLVAGG